jgi:hypothetical protein
MVRTMTATSLMVRTMTATSLMVRTITVALMLFVGCLMVAA